MFTVATVAPTRRLNSMPWRRSVIVATIGALSLATISSGWAAESPRARNAAIRNRLEVQLEKPSVHDEPEAIDQALADAGVAEDTIVAFHHAVSQATLPSMTASIDAFLFFTRDPQWLALRQHFCEFLEVPDVLEPNAATMRLLADYDGVATLPSVTELSPKAAAACQHFGEASWGAALEFPGVTEITPEAALALARCEALLVFPNLRKLSVEGARGLAEHDGMGLVLGGLTSLEPDTAAALSKIKSERGLVLSDLVILESVPLANRLARQDHVFLPAVKRLSPEIAKALRGSDGGELALPALEEIPTEVAKELVGAGYFWLSLGGAQALSPEAAAVLAEHHAQLAFPGPESFSPVAAAKLAKHRHAIVLPHVAALPADVARALAPHKHTLVLGSVTHLSVDDAAALSAHKGHVVLPSLARLTPEVAATLAPRIATIALPGLRSIDAETAAALAAHARDDLAIPGVTSLTPDVAAALAAFKGSLSLPSVTSLTPDAARALAAHQGMLSLEALDVLDADVATALAQHAGGLDLSSVSKLSDASGTAIASAAGRLMLGGVSEIHPEAARALASRTDPLELDALVYVQELDSPAVAELLVKHCDDLALELVASLTGPDAVEIARILVRTRGTLELPGLERISPRALEVLLGRSKITLPDLADIEIVPEAGQLGNDDFIEPRR
jgi:hypothetical protein